VASRKNPETSAEQNIAEAAEKASLVIRGLQSRLRQRSPEVIEETREQLEQQLQQYFAKTDIRTRVIDGVVERIFRQWDQGALEADVVNRLIDLVAERLAR
jgi:hypothetical protein